MISLNPYINQLIICLLTNSEANFFAGGKEGEDLNDRSKLFAPL
jgi:hypothetical protein